MEIKSLYEDGLSIPQISDRLGIPRSTVRSRLLADGVTLRTRADAVKIAAADGRLGQSMKGKKRAPFSPEWKAKISRARLAHSSKNAKGLSLKPNGYVEYTKGPHKGRGQHVVLMEKKIGRKLFSNECVHHKNHIRHDNRLRNLQLMTRAEHAALHAKEIVATRQRTNDGRFK